MFLFALKTLFFLPLTSYRLYKVRRRLNWESLDPTERLGITIMVRSTRRMPDVTINAGMLRYLMDTMKTPSREECLSWLANEHNYTSICEKLGTESWIIIKNQKLPCMRWNY